MMNEWEKSAPLVVVEKPANNSAPAEAESVEPRRGTKGNTVETHMRRTQRRESVLLGLARVRERAKTRKKETFTGLLHHITVDLLRSSYFSLKRKAAPGIDRVTWFQCGETLEENLNKLHGRVHRGAYRPKPSRRLHTQKRMGSGVPWGLPRWRIKSCKVPLWTSSMRFTKKTSSDSPMALEAVAVSTTL